jgi:hypothetical protein
MSPYFPSSRSCPGGGGEHASAPCLTCGRSAFGPDPVEACPFVSAPMGATCREEALATLGAAALSGYSPLALIDMLDYARVAPSAVLDGVRREFVTAPDPRGRA